MTSKRKPVIGCAFDPDQMNEREGVASYIGELEYYRPRGFSKLRNEGNKLLSPANDLEWASEWMTDCDTLLTEWARRVERHDFICYGPFEHGGAVGFYIVTDNAIEEADLKVDDTGQVPRGFSGLVIQISDHGNVTAYQYSRGKSRELFAVV